MDCKKAEDIILTDYIDAKVTPQVLKEVEAHLASCSRCSALAARLKSVSAALRQAERIEPSAEVWEKIRSEIGEKTPQVVFSPGFFEPIRIFFTRLKPAMVITATAAVILVVLTVARIAPHKGIKTIQDDMISLVTLYENGTSTGCDFGTSVENYFL
jgi:anti-sigma factor RsiW